MATPSIAPKSAAKKPTRFDELSFAVKVVILAVLLAVVSAIYYFALHMGLSEQIDAANTQHTTLIGQRQEAERRQQEYLRITQELADREALDRLNKRILPENAEVPSFLQDVNRVAELSGLQIRRVEPLEEAEEEKYTRIPIEFELEGRFHQFAKFFYNTSRIERAASMAHLNIELHSTSQRQEISPNGTLPEVRLTVKVEATAFRRPVADQEAAPPAATPPANEGGN